MPYWPPSQSGSSVPSGTIVLWSGTLATIPSGWFLCNGQNGTPDLRNRFVIGASVDQAGEAKTDVFGYQTKTGGSLTHQHAYTAAAQQRSGTVLANSSPNGYYDAKSDVYGTTGIQTQDAGKLPPYYALAFIMKG